MRFRQAPPPFSLTFREIACFWRYLPINSVDSPRSSPHAGHFLATAAEYTAPQLVQALSDCLLTTNLLADIRRRNH
jgi:hypothetical protein